MRRTYICFVVALAIVTAYVCGAYAVRWSPSELDIAQEPGAQETYRLLLENDSEESAELRLYVADWQRTLDGVNDFSIPRNGARWQLDRTFTAGESITIRYTVELPTGGAVDVQGSLRTWSPQLDADVLGVGSISSNAAETPSDAPSGDFVTARRSIESVRDGLATIQIEIRTAVDFDGLTIEEEFSQGVQVTSIEDADGQFDTVNRSSADWIQLPYDQVRLDAGESREILMTITTPTAYEGMYWCILQAESRPRLVGEVQGTQIISVPSVGMKIYVSAPGTELLAGEVVDVEAIPGDPLEIHAQFANTGNVQLVVTSEAQVVNQTGEVIRRLQFSEFGREYFRILPGSTREISIIDYTGGDPLGEGIYQAVVSFDFGGDSIVVGAKAFRVR